MAGRKNVADYASSAAPCLQAYCITIATILGTGVLGLPVTLSRSGMSPFLVSFLVDAVMQSVLIHFFVDLLQRTYAIQMANHLKEEASPLSKRSDDSSVSSTNAKKRSLIVTQEFVPMSPNLHLMGELFLYNGVRQTFDLLIIFQFVALLICYSLAGSEAYAQLLGIDHFYVIPVFVWVLTLSIIFALKLLQPIISFLTVVKGSVLLATTAVTFYVGTTLGRSSHSNFTYIRAPFLMGTVAIGGTINTMPFTFERIAYNKHQIKKYRLSVQLALWTCVILNILWCWSVLDIVPQTVEEACRELADRSRLLSLGKSSARPPPSSGALCFGELSLESAKANGEISTIPMTKTLIRDFPRYAWVAVLVEFFIMVSITVSYLTIGGALHHTLMGVAQSVILYKLGGSSPVSHCSILKNMQLVSSLLSFLVFDIVFGISMSDPEGFVDILEKLASLTINAQAGIFVFLMLLASRKVPDGDAIPVPLPFWCPTSLVWAIMVFFNAAVCVDVWTTLEEMGKAKRLLHVVLVNGTVVDKGSTTVAPWKSV